jgi:hypothetical protein
VFLVKEPKKKGICSTAYLNQVLKTVVFSFYNSLTPKQQEKFIFIKDRAKVYKEKARLSRLNKGIRGFD